MSVNEHCRGLAQNTYLSRAGPIVQGKVVLERSRRRSFQRRVRHAHSGAAPTHVTDSDDGDGDQEVREEDADENDASKDVAKDHGRHP